MAKKQKPSGGGAERRARVEAMKREQKAKERRKTIGFIAIAAVIGGTLIAIPAVKIINDSKEKARAFNELGVPAAAAACDPVLTDEVGSDDGEHENDPTVTISYDTAPPSHGPHFVQWATINSRGFYTPSDAPRVEELVHNLEHGYNIVWYTEDADEGQLEDLRTIAEKMRDEGSTFKFIAVPWDTARGAFPEGKTIALSHWGAPTEGRDYASSTGYRQYCGQVSGEAIKTFVDDHPITDAPEPGAA